MSGKIEQGSRVQLLAKVERISFDPTDYDVEITVDGTDYPATWTGPAVKVSTNPDRWTRPAISTDYFAGAPEADTVALTKGRHSTSGMLTKGTERVAFRGDPIEVA